MSNTNNTDKPNDAQGSSNRHVRFQDNSKKKEKKKPKFQTGYNESIESINSSASEDLLVEVDHQDELIVDQEVNISFLKKYLNTSSKVVSPRPTFHKPCKLQLFSERKDFISEASFQFFESIKPSPDDFNRILIRAATLGQVRAAKKAVRKGADVNVVNDMQTPLMLASEAGDARFVAFLLSVPGIQINVKNSLGQTPLIVAVANGHDSVVRLLLKHNADVNVTDNMGKTALHVALFNQHINVIKLLLAFGANYDLEDCFGEKPIYTATVKKPNLHCLKMLLKMGASPDYFTLSGVPLLSRTILNGTQFKIIETLVEQGASVNSTDNISKKTPLHFAALANNTRAAEFLVKSGADTTLKTSYGFTPLDEALIQKNYEVKMFLLDLHKKETVKVAKLVKRANRKNE